MENDTRKVFIPDDEGNIKRGINIEMYTHIRAYHACRPINFDSYFSEGIKPYNLRELRQMASATFGIPESTVIAIDSRLQSSNINNVYFSMFKQELLDESSHYLCWGSEYLLDIAVQLDKDNSGKYHDLLSNIGIPTIFICDLPLALLSQSQRDNISEFYNPCNSNFTCWISEKLKPEYIIAHEHPSQIFNQIQRIDYKNKQTTCNWCTSTK
ncbi:hypothetical protein LG276_05490 [Cytobacillus kochii]|uniref:hypothetical protein n=1 Tax=Cytobacillus kochii TaxID=859143 RepID=UPI00247FE943|nr:hypothetical protein [Cytobacillus kochii]